MGGEQPYKPESPLTALEYLHKNHDAAGPLSTDAVLFLRVFIDFTDYLYAYLRYISSRLVSVVVATGID